MGARSNIRMIYSGGGEIYLYTHWGSNTHCIDAVKRALKKGKRWSDQSYLGRIIASEFLKDDIDGTTGMGIAPYPGEEQYGTTVVDMVHQTVNGKPFNEFIK